MSNMSRTVILGANGFIGGTIARCLKKARIPIVPMSREQIDFTDESAPSTIAKLLQPEDAVVITAAKAPCKNNAMLLDNILMMERIGHALQQQPVSHVIYISSDAVYADSMRPLTESSPTAPSSLHGVMHLAREWMLASIIDANKLLFLRPTLVYGKADPHNGYGPNQFYRLASRGESIQLFGEGEEQRDHVCVEDVAEITQRCLQQRLHGTLNVVTGQTLSFAEIAAAINPFVDTPVKINYLPRKGPMPHNGYRAFDITRCQHLFPDFKYRTFNEGMALMRGAFAHA